MKIFRIVLIMLAVVAYAPVLAGVAHAQAIDVPETATGALGMLIAFFGSSYFSGWLSSILTSALKSVTTRWKFITPEDVPLISGLWTNLVIAILAALSAQATVFLTPAAQYLDASGLWAVIAAALYFAHQYYISDKTARVNEVIALSPTIEMTSE